VTYAFLLRCPRCGKHIVDTATPDTGGMFQLRRYCPNSDYGYMGSEDCFWRSIPLEVLRVDLVGS